MKDGGHERGHGSGEDKEGGTYWLTRLHLHSHLHSHRRMLGMTGLWQGMTDSGRGGWCSPRDLDNWRHRA